MFKRKKKNDFEIYEEESMNLASKEEEIMDSYLDEALSTSNDLNFEDEYEEEYEANDSFTTNASINEETFSEEYYNYEDEDEDEDDSSYYINNEKKYKRIINIVFTIIILVLAMIAIDVISVARYNIGPFFAIPIEKYKDGGSKAYYGLGYKVIKYNQIQGRRDTEIGFWNLKYNAEPVTLKDLDLAIELTEKGTDTYKKYYKKFVRVVSTLETIDTENNKITLSYQDEGKKYSLDIECSMATKKSALENLTENKEITIIGTVTDYKSKTKEKPNKLYISNCFAEQ